MSVANRTPLSFSGAGRENAEVMPSLTAVTERVLSGEALLNGPEIFDLEAKLAERTGRSYAVAVNSATDALFFALTGIGIGRGDEVLVPNFSFVASASAVVRCGARPVFTEVIAPTPDALAVGTMDLSDAARRITPRTRAMVWVGLYGGFADPAPIEMFAAKHDLILVEDASQSFGAAFAGRPAGTLGTASCFSFDRNKSLAAPGTGGAVMTDDPDLQEHVRSLRYHGRDGGGFGRLGYNSQMSSVTAAILLLKLHHQDGWMARRAAVAKRYDTALADHVGILRWAPEVLHARHKYVILTAARDALAWHLKSEGVPTLSHYREPLSRLALFDGGTENPGDFPHAEAIAAQALSLPIYAQLSEAEVERIIETVLRFFE